jgi:hypothetical protein
LGSQLLFQVLDPTFLFALPPNSLFELNESPSP